MAPVQQATIKADGIDVFYRTAGPKDAPVILLLHGFPSSSFMFRNLIPLLSNKYRVIAPDIPGYGFTTVPEERKYVYTFDNLAKTIKAFLDVLEVKRFAPYMFDYGAPITIRLALAYPESISAIITQNGNAYDEGFGADFWAPLRQFWADPTPAMREGVAKLALSFDTTKWQYQNGFPNPEQVNPETYWLDYSLMTRPGNAEIQVDLFYDYRVNPASYPKFHQYLRDSKVPVLAVWGKNDDIFIAPGAEAFKRDAVDPEIHLIDAGHFAIETNEEKFAELINDFLQRRLA
jgi:pimeloyl-ACP methyl ester carboxylesterase